MTSIGWMAVYSLLTLGSTAAWFVWVATSPTKPIGPRPYRSFGQGMAALFYIMLALFYIVGSNLIGWVMVLYQHFWK